MSPNSIFALLFMALMIDWLSIGPDDWRDRLAFCLGMPAIRAGWDGSPADRATIDLISTWVEEIKKTGNATLAQTSTASVISVLAAALAIYCFGVLAPAKWSNKLGKLALATFRGKSGAAAAGGPPVAGPRVGGKGRQLNPKLWACAYLIAITVELTGGLVGMAAQGSVSALTKVVGFVPGLVFGVS
ncbi:hypothetical protein Val02_82240 [Virgisporangium aliadipatigenens]|uniref:Uncharacterized protein n=1 Tax=Virgisporangium aliadipatigenens TaxID=741659 RepID=A0A8J3YXB3_9ACTN|nr:hypothetical protein [Virgisporangium aliadipatigenens]GIJ51338.1 hypothetical protein Val02_82240 [Virgisporangium aliadipatigenens]